MRTHRLLILLAAAAALAAPPALLAQPKQERDAAAAPGQLSEVGQGERLARQEMRPGAYITPRHRAAVRAWLARHHGPGKPCLPGLVKQGQACRAPDGAAGWKIGSALPGAVKLHGLPAGLLATLPRTPPGNRYVLLSGDILLMASRSRIVVDAVPAGE